MFDFVKTVRRVLVLEETDQVLEAMLGDRSKVLGRANGYVPGAGEITYDVVRDVIARIVNEEGSRGCNIFPR